MSRSYLFIPGDVPRMLQHLDVFGADAVIIDFEDAVHVDQKEDARYLVKSFLAHHQLTSPELFIRINAVDDPFFIDDVKVVSSLPIKGIVLPKASHEALTTLSKHISSLDVIALIETPSAFFELKEIASHKSVIGLMLGGEDLTRSIDAERTTEGLELLFARSQIIMAAKSYGKEAIDTPFTKVNDLQGLNEDARLASQLGFSAKACIHPNHIDAIHQAFTPNERTILEAKRIVKKSEEVNSTRFSLDGKMVDKPIIERAKALLKRSQKYQERR